MSLIATTPLKADPAAYTGLGRITQAGVQQQGHVGAAASGQNKPRGKVVGRAEGGSQTGWDIR